MFSFLFLIFSTVFFPLWASVLFFVLLAILFKKLWEGIVAGIFLDSLYFSPLFFSKFNLDIFTVSFVLFILIFERFRRLINVGV